MPRCEITGKGVVPKNLVSHSNIKTKSKAFSNIQGKTFFSDQLRSSFHLKVATRTIRTIDKIGSFDVFLLKQPDQNLSPYALSIKKKIIKKTSKKKAGKKLSSKLKKEALDESKN